MDLDGENAETIMNLSNSTWDGSHIAHDGISQTLLLMNRITPSTTSAIFMVSMDGKHRKKLVIRYSVMIQDMVAYDGKVYYTSAFPLTIHRYDLLTEKEIYYRIYYHYRYVSIDSLAVDSLDEHIYWSSVSLGTIQRLDLNLRNLETIFSYWISAPRSIDVYAHRLYWFDSKQHIIFSIDKDGVYDKEPITAEVNGLPKDLTVIKDSSKAGKKLWLITSSLRLMFHSDFRIILMITLTFNGILYYSSSERRLVYLVAKNNTHSSRCLATCTNDTRLADPINCTAGYKYIKLEERCEKCSEDHGNGTMICPCRDDAMCSAKRSANITACPTATPFLNFIVRICAKGMLKI